METALEYIEKTHNYIKDNWDNALVKPYGEGIFKLPCPFVPPCITGHFQTLFYWDAFFTGEGMIADGKSEYAKYNTDNLLHLLKHLGYVPNSASANGAKWCSQPPYLYAMVRSVFNSFKDLAWLKASVELLENEYSFWMKHRISPNGLNRHGHNELNDASLIDYYAFAARRLRLNPDVPNIEKTTKAANSIAEAEAGEDYTPRFDRRAMDFNPVDLNSNLYGFETAMAEFHSLLGNTERAQAYLEYAASRKKLMDKYCFNRASGAYYDYDYKNRRLSTLHAAAQLMQFWTGLNTDADAFKMILQRLEGAFGIAACEDKGGFDILYQWAYPNAWPPNAYIAIQSALKLNLSDTALRLSKKYLVSVADTFIKTGHLWEKYDVNMGGKAIHHEYPLTEMFGWTAGVFETAYLICRSVNN